MYELCCGLKMFLTLKDSVNYLKEQFGFDKQTLINLVTILQANENEIHSIVESCFQTNSISELKVFIENKI